MRLSRTTYGLISVFLGIISLAIIAAAIWGIWLTTQEETILDSVLLRVIAFIMIGIAVFDICKFLFEEKISKSTVTKPHLANDFQWYERNACNHSRNSLSDKTSNK